jgi:uncharacterized protein DUF1566/type IX secretion system substrate protein
MKTNMSLIILGLLIGATISATAQLPFEIVDTGQEIYYNNTSVISAPAVGDAFFGQDAGYSGNQPSYIDNGDGTISDNVTGLMWEKSFSRVAWNDAASAASAAVTGGHSDWRVPTIKELYSLINFNGNQGTGSPDVAIPPDNAVPFLDTDFFDFEYPSHEGARYIDAQYITSTVYTGLVMSGTSAFFGVNFADGRIKGYPINPNPNQSGEFYVRFVRENNGYGKNDLQDKGDGTITDEASGLMWSKFDSGNEEFSSNVASSSKKDGTLNWQEALAFCEENNYAGHSDWRLPNAKELQGIVDYTRSPQATESAAIDPMFAPTSFTNEGGWKDFPWYWSSTTFLPGNNAIYVCFGEGLGYFQDKFQDVHGAGCQRTDPKTGTPDYGHGPQGDVRRIFNYVLMVRDADPETGIEEEANHGEMRIYPNPASDYCVVETETSGSILVISNALGEKVFVKNISSVGQIELDLSQYQAGIYFVTIKTGSSSVTGKLIKM